MIYLHLALYSEGPTDDLFLSTIIERTARQIVLGSKGEVVEIQPIFLVKPYLKAGGVSEIRKGGNEKMLQAARTACEYDLLIVHMDADTQTHEEAKETRFEPGKTLIEQTPTTEKVCRCLVPLVPVKMIESWMLADWQTVLDEIGTNMTPQALRAELKKQELTLPSKPQQAASVLNPKHTLEQIIKITRRRRGMTLNDLYEPLGSSIRLETLNKVESYKRFDGDLKEAISNLGKVRL